MKRTDVSHSKKEETFSSQVAEYESLFRESHQQPPIENATDPMYLEPVTNDHYEEIKNVNETDDQMIAGVLTVNERI